MLQCLKLMHRPPIWAVLQLTTTFSNFPTSQDQCWKLSQKSCRSSCLESQIINIKLKKNQQKVPSPPPKLSASDRRTCGNFQHWPGHSDTILTLYLLLWQMVCDAKNRILNVTANWPGGTHDSHVFQASGLGRHLAQGMLPQISKGSTGTLCFIIFQLLVDQSGYHKS